MFILQIISILYQIGISLASEYNNGVIVADVVGLGKTIIACAIAKQLKKRGIIICPPGIMGDKNKNSGWKKYIEEFKLHDWEAWSLGDLKNAFEFVKKSKDIEAVIVDEAHRFRNQDTKDYELLKNICREKQVILLTATPFNNHPSDIFSLLSLFIAPKKSSITLDGNLADQFKSFKGVFDRLRYIKKYWNSPSDNIKRAKALNYYKALFEEDSVDLKKVSGRARYLARQIRNVIEPVTIRRNRLDLQGNPLYKNEVKQLSEVADPLEWPYKLSKEQSEFYDEIIGSYFLNPDLGGKFKGAIYRPFEYEKGGGELTPCKNFLRTLKEDILSYGTLADYTLRRIANFKEDAFKDIKELKDEMGEDYLIKEKKRQKNQQKEIIIAIKNIKQ